MTFRFLISVLGEIVSEPKPSVSYTESLVTNSKTSCDWLVTERCFVVFSERNEEGGRTIKGRQGWVLRGSEHSFFFPVMPFFASLVLYFYFLPPQWPWSKHSAAWTLLVASKMLTGSAFTEVLSRYNKILHALQASYSHCLIWFSQEARQIISFYPYQWILAKEVLL